MPGMAITVCPGWRGDLINSDQSASCDFKLNEINGLSIYCGMIISQISDIFLSGGIL
jgi:hypothetical protein